MTRKAPPPRPRRSKFPNYQKIDGTTVIIVPGKERSHKPLPDTDSDLIEIERVMARYVDAVNSQRFDWECDENGDLRQCWCPHCGQITAVIRFHCEKCREWFGADAIEDQFEMPDVAIPNDVAWDLYEPFLRILWGKDASEVFNLKKRKNRARGVKRAFQRNAAQMVQDLIDKKGISKNRACKEVAQDLGDDNGYPDDRTVSGWYKKYY